MKVGRYTKKAAPAALALLMCVAASGQLEGQAFRYGAGWTLGGSYLTELNPDAAGTALEPGLGFLFGLHLERGYGNDARFAVRYQGTYMNVQMPWVDGDRNIDAVSADVAVLARALNPREYTIWPYLMAGGGGVWYDLGRGPISSFPQADAYHDGSSFVLPFATAGVGVDLPMGWTWDTWPVRVRLEAADQMTFGSPLRQLSDQDRYGPVHHLRFTFGAYTGVEYLR